MTLTKSKWKKTSWRRGVKGPLSAGFAALRIRPDGPPQRILDKGQQHLPGEEAWLIVEWRASGAVIRRARERKSMNDVRLLNERQASTEIVLPK